MYIQNKMLKVAIRALEPKYTLVSKAELRSYLYSLILKMKIWL